MKHFAKTYSSLIEKFRYHLCWVVLPGGGAGEAMTPPIFFEIVGFTEILMFRRRIFVLLLLVKIRICVLSEDL